MSSFCSTGIKFLAKRATISGHTWCGAMACEQTFDKKQQELDSLDHTTPIKGADIC